jgi:hypothetical protein
MVSSEVQRTLVKSPPELWAELSDPAALARHLGELGEIRITRTKPEERVEWEADGISGTVLLKASGWGTKVTLSVTREIDEPRQPDPELDDPTATPGDEAMPQASEADDTAAVDGPEGEGDARAAELETDAAPTSEIESTTDTAPTPELDADAQPEEDPDSEDGALPPTAAEPELARLAATDPPAPPRRGFFARLFRRREQPAPAPEPVAAHEPASSPAAETKSKPMPTAEAQAEPVHIESAIESLQARYLAELDLDADEPTPAPEEATTAEEAPQATIGEPSCSAEDEPPETAVQTPSDPPVDLAAELQAAEEVAAEEVAAVLTAVLDRLGAAHHRPFSRA